MTNTGNNDTEEPAEETTQTENGLGLSPTQVIAGGGAAAVASVIGGHLGLAGTVVGAFILSVISAIALPLFRASLERSHKQIKRVMPKRVSRARSRMQPGQRAHRLPRTPPASSGPPPAKSPLRPCRRGSPGQAWPMHGMPPTNHPGAERPGWLSVEQPSSSSLAWGRSLASRQPRVLPFRMEPALSSPVFPKSCQIPTTARALPPEPETKRPDS